MYTELKTALAMWCEDPFPGWGGGEAVLDISGCYFNTSYQTLFLVFFLR